MIARQTSAREDLGTKGDSAPPSKAAQRPTAFMFIDSSNGGVNAKPDRAVRSFVMKSARKKKLWSTRPRSPYADRAVSLHLERRSISQDQRYNEELQPIDHLSHSESNMHAEAWEKHMVISPSSSRSDSSHSSNWVHGSPVSTYISSHVEYEKGDYTLTLTSASQDLSTA